MESPSFPHIPDWWRGYVRGQQGVVKPQTGFKGSAGSSLSSLRQSFGLWKLYGSWGVGGSHTVAYVHYIQSCGGPWWVFENENDGGEEGVVEEAPAFVGLVVKLTLNVRRGVYAEAGISRLRL